MADKPQLPDSKFQELQKAWKTRPQPGTPGYDPEYDQFLHFVAEKYARDFDPPIDKRNTGLNWVMNRVNDVADYPSGLLRTAVRGGVSVANGGTSLPQLGQDAIDAVNPFDGKPAPSSKEYSKRDGMGEGAPLSQTWMGGLYAKPGAGGPLQPAAGGPLDFKTGNVRDFATDALLNPQLYGSIAKAGLQSEGETAASMRAGGVPSSLGQKVAGAVASSDPLELAIRKAAEKYYASAFRGISPKAAKAMIEQNLWGTGRGVQGALESRLGELGDQARSTIQGVDSRYPGIMVPTDSIATRVVDGAERRFNSPPTNASSWKGLMEAAPDLEAMPEQMPLDDLYDAKQGWQNKAAKQGAYNRNPQKSSGRTTGAANRDVAGEVTADAYKDAANESRILGEDAMDAVEPGSGGDLSRTNQDISDLIGAKKPVADNANASLLQTLQDHPILPALGIGGVGHMALSHAADATHILGTAAALAGNSTLAKTGLGLLGAKGSQLPANLSRAALIDAQNPEERAPSPWTLLQRDMK